MRLSCCFVPVGRAFAPGRLLTRPPADPVSGVGHPASSAVLRLLSVFPAALYSSVAGEPAIGVGHPASWAWQSRLLTTRPIE